jgi:hypothetical protein
VPVVVPRDPPPLYSWEVMPGLYRAVAPPRIPRWRVRQLAAWALLGTAIGAVALAGIFGYYAAIAPTPGNFTVAGTVELQSSSGGADPVGGAHVTATVDSGASYSTSTDGSGGFTFPDLPSGGVSLEVTYAGYSPVTVDVFVSTLYTAGATGTVIVLSPGSASNGSSYTLTPFPDLEQFVAAIGSGVAVLGLVAILAGYAAVVTLRADRPALGVVAGGAGLLAPFALLLLSLGSVFPFVVAGSATLTVLGGFALSIRAVQMAQTGPAPD